MNFKWKILPVVFTGLLASSAFAGSTVIRGNILDDKGITPALGRGYSPITGTYQSTCYSEVPTTKGSYDMKFYFKEIDKNWKNAFTSHMSLSGSFSYLFVSAHVTGTADNSGVFTGGHKKLYAQIDLDSYYNSLDESKAVLSDKAKNLLESNDLTGFFNSCGTHYIRGIGRNSQFLAMLDYKTKSTETDTQFEAKVQAKVRSIFGYGGSINTETSGSFHHEAEERELTISVWAQGIDKDHQVALAPTSFEEFRTSVSEAILAMQGEDIGMVTSMEVVPWFENIDFQDSVKLKSDGEELLYAQKRNLQRNSGLVATLDNIERAMTDDYYKALNCQQALLDEFPTQAGEFGFGDVYNPDKTMIENNVYPSDKTKFISLKKLMNFVSDERIEGMVKKQEDFSKAQYECIEALHNAGLEEIDYHEIDSCKSIATDFRYKSSKGYDMYCLPRLGEIKSE